MSFKPYNGEKGITKVCSMFLVSYTRICYLKYQLQQSSHETVQHPSSAWFQLQYEQKCLAYKRLYFNGLAWCSKNMTDEVAIQILNHPFQITEHHSRLSHKTCELSHYPGFVFRLTLPHSALQLFNCSSILIDWTEIYLQSVVASQPKINAEYWCSFLQ